MAFRVKEIYNIGNAVTWVNYLIEYCVRIKFFVLNNNYRCRTPAVQSV